MLDNAVDQQTGMIKLRAIFENDERQLWPGQFIRARLILSTMPDAVIIPFSAVQMTLSDPIVFIAKDDNTVEQRTVKLGQRDRENVIALSGVQGGEKIITDGQINLYPGAKIFVPGT
jgi:multidrug efflux system membrane fusion protein